MYYAVKKRQTDPSVRAVRDAELLVEIRRVHKHSDGSKPATTPRSRGRCARSPGIMVRRLRARLTPSSPVVRISRSTPARGHRVLHASAIGVEPARCVCPASSPIGRGCMGSSSGCAGRPTSRSWFGGPGFPSLRSARTCRRSKVPVARRGTYWPCQPSGPRRSRRRRMRPSATRSSRGLHRQALLGGLCLDQLAGPVSCDREP